MQKEKEEMTAAAPMVVKRVYPVDKHRFNVAAWINPITKHTVLIGRQLDHKGSTGEPDFSRLVLTEMDEAENIIFEKVIWENLEDHVLFEDPRAMIIDNNHIVIGLSALLRSKTGFDPYPAILKIDLDDWNHDVPPPMIILNFGPGKNLTPVDDNHFLFRPEGASYSHRLIVFCTDDHVPVKTQDLFFPTDLPWALWRIGTSIPPIWINESEAIMIFHGISMDKNKYIYSLGKARLSKENDHYQIQVAREPILTPDDIKRKYKSIESKELHPRLRRVLYACGGIHDSSNPDILKLLVNVGDSDTYKFEISIKELKKGLFPKE